MSKLKSKNAKETDIFHSYAYCKADAKMRKDMAFDKDFHKTLSKEDKLLMRGYAQRAEEERRSFLYKNPNYIRKTKGKGATYNSARILKHVKDCQI